MFILDKPYVSEFMIDTIVKNDWAILDNEQIKDAGIEEDAFNLWSEKKAINYYSMQEFPLIYSNSEGAISWVLKNLPKSNLSEYIKLFKDKFAFRELLKEIYPSFNYQTIEYLDLKDLKPSEIKYPVVIKPTVGFLSFGVHKIYNEDEWKDAISKLGKEIAIAGSMYPSSMVNATNFIIEDLIEGDEYAIDAYFDRNGDVVILNIFEHPFLNSQDVRDRIYVMSASIMIRYMAKFGLLLHQIGELKNIRNFPLHIEVIVTNEGNIIPIEINPMRFAGWCTTDVAKYAWGINSYEYFYKQLRPDWNTIIENSDKKIYYFSMAEVPTSIPKNAIREFNYDKYLSNFSNVLEVRRINHANNPLFAVIFGSTTEEDEIQRILALKTEEFC